MVDNLTKSNTKPLDNGNTKVEEFKAKQEESKTRREELKFKQASLIRKRSFAEKRIVQARKSALGVARLFQRKGPSKLQILMRRKAQVQRMRALQAQRQGVISEGREDNKFNRRIIEQQMRDDFDEKRRRFIEVPNDFEARKDALRQLKIRRAREFALRSNNNILKTHEGMLKVKLDLLRTDDTCNLCKAPRIWNQDNPDNNIFADRGRPTIMDARNVFETTNETRRWNILNAQRLNFGNVDTRRKPRKFNYNPADEVF